MYGRLEKYPTKFDPVLKALINKCLEKDENKRLSAREMIEFQNKIEQSAYGEVRSGIMVKKIMENYIRIKDNPGIIIEKDEYSKYGQGGYTATEKYNIPQFFLN